MTITSAEAVAKVRERFGVEPIADNALVTVDVPAERWEALGRVARDDIGCLYFNWLSAIDWKEQGLEVVFEDHRFQNRFYRRFLALTHVGNTLELLQQLLVSDLRPHCGLTLVKEQVIGRDVEHLGEFFHHVN